MKQQLGKAARRVAQTRRTALEVMGVGAIASAGFTVHEGWAFLIVGGYLVLAANSGMKGGRR